MKWKTRFSFQVLTYHDESFKMYDIVRGDSAVKNGKASITARLGCQGRCVQGRGHLLGEEEEGSFKDIMIWRKVYLTKQAAGISMFLVLAIRFVKIKSQS